MGRQALLAVVCWLTISQTFGGKPKLSLAIQDNESAESAPRLYRNVPVGVYASGAPYAAYSFQLPTFAAPQSAASQPGVQSSASHPAPARENYVHHLTDSYGNKFVAPQLATYKISFPQQFVPLQQLPQHLAQPLVAASANFQFKQSNGQFVGTPYRVPATLQGPAPTPLNQFPTFGQLYGGDKAKNLAPTTVTQYQPFFIPNTQQQSTINKGVFTTTQPNEKYGNLKNEPKLSHQKEPQLIIGKPKVQGITEIPHESHEQNRFQKIQEVHTPHGESISHHQIPQSSRGEVKFQPDSPHYESKFTITHDTPNVYHSGAKFQRIQDASHSHNDNPRAQQLEHESSRGNFGLKLNGQQQQELPHYESKFEPTHETPNIHHGDVKFQSPYLHNETPKSQPQTSQSSHGETNSNQHHPELSHYESKFQIIEEPSNAPQHQRIQEHHEPHEEVKYQHFHEASPPTTTQQSYERPREKPQHVRQSEKSHSNKGKLQAAPGKQTVTYINDIDGKKTIVELDTTPKLPLLDISLLEPLKFDTPFVPQVQHFLPRINQAKYHKLPEINMKKYQKEFVVSKTTAYDSAEAEEKPQKDTSKKKQKKLTQSNKYPKKNDVPKKTTVTYYDPLGDAPEITYEISSPNYKETIKQKAVSYNKETESEPVHYTYGSQTDKEPVTYSYSRASKEPLQITTVEYEGNGPSEPIFSFKPKEHVHEEKSYPPALHHNESEEDRKSSHESDEGFSYHRNTDQNEEHPKSTGGHYETSHRGKQNHHKQNIEKPQEVVYNSIPKYHSEPVHFTSENINFQPILREYETNIRLLTTPSASIKVDPHQHVQLPKSTPSPQTHENNKEHSQPNHRPQSAPVPQNYHHSLPEQQKHPSHSTPERQQHHHNNPQSYGPAPHIHEKSKQVIIHDEAPNEMHSLREKMREEVINQEENSEEDFEKAYEDAALGFPAHSRRSPDGEQDIFDPESYGVPRDHIQYDFENTPFQQYQAEGDEFPKESRSSYKDAREKMMQNYYSDYSISKPESLLDKYQNKLSYYKLFKDQKPDYLADVEANDKKQKSAKFTAAPSFNFHSAQDNGKSYYGYSKPKQQPLYEYDYSNGAPRDSSAFASRPYQIYKARTKFVEPQFQYGFAPVKRLDSELAAMASNVSPESEKPGMRKKVYKENWYIKKTSSSAPAS